MKLIKHKGLIMADKVVALLRKMPELKGSKDNSDVYIKAFENTLEQGYAFIRLNFKVREKGANKDSYVIVANARGMDGYIVTVNQGVYWGEHSDGGYENRKHPMTAQAAAKIVYNALKK